jgi:hypothetical protein
VALPFLKEQGEEMVEEVDNNAEVLNFEEAVKRARLNAPGPVADGFRYVNLSYILVETTVVIYRISNFTVPVPGIIGALGNNRVLSLKLTYSTKPTKHLHQITSQYNLLF